MTHLVYFWHMHLPGSSFWERRDVEPRVEVGPRASQVVNSSVCRIWNLSAKQGKLRSKPIFATKIPLFNTWHKKMRCLNSSTFAVFLTRVENVQKDSTERTKQFTTHTDREPASSVQPQAWLPPEHLQNNFHQEKVVGFASKGFSIYCS